MSNKNKYKSSNSRKSPRLVPVKPHVRKGESVRGHKRTKPDGIISNNHSSK